MRRAIPIVVSIAVLGWLARQVDGAQLLGALSPGIAWRMGLALTLYGALTLLLEALSLRILIPGNVKDFSAWTAARIKCASYLLAILNYALGAGALVVLLRKRTQLGLAAAGSLVLLISSVDMVVVLSVVAVGGAFLKDIAPAVPGALVAVVLLGFPSALWLLRTRHTLGPLEPLRNFPIFSALREIAIPRLVRLFCLRLLFVGCFTALCSASFPIFGVQAPLPDVVVGTLIVGFVAGLGTSQAAFLFLFSDYASQEALLAQSLVLSAGMLTLRALMGIAFAREFTREALQAVREDAE